MRIGRRRRRRSGWACATGSGRMMSVGARAERMVAHRLFELERQLDTANDETAPRVWKEYYVALDLWLRLRTPTPGNPPLTKAMLAERFHATRTGTRR